MGRRGREGKRETKRDVVCRDGEYVVRIELNFMAYYVKMYRIANSDERFTTFLKAGCGDRLKCVPQLSIPSGLNSASIMVTCTDGPVYDNCRGCTIVSNVILHVLQCPRHILQ